MNKLQTSVTPGFSQLGAGNGSLVIVNDVGAYADTDIHLLLFPAVGATLACSAGQVRYGQSVKPVDVDGGVLTFSGSSSSTLPRVPVDVLPELQVLFAFDETGQPVGAGAQLTANGEVVMSQPCTAAVAYTGYRTTGREIIYSPKIENIGQGARVTFGVIAAYYQGTLTTFQTEPFNIDDGSSVWEIYRIVSPAVTTQAGEFEKPPGYPTTGTYPGKALVIRVAVSLLTERVHELGYMDRSGRGFSNVFTVTKLEPYIGDNTYKPTKTMKTISVDSITVPDDPRLSKELQLKALAIIKARGLGKL